MDAAHMSTEAAPNDAAHVQNTAADTRPRVKAVDVTVTMLDLMRVRTPDRLAGWAVAKVVAPVAAAKAGVRVVDDACSARAT